MFGVYIHIPFCLQRCPFCDFTLVTNFPASLIENYVEDICKEIELIDRNLWQEDVTSVYFGGGTPSFIDPLLIEKILFKLREKFRILPKAEITLETNPEDVTQLRTQLWEKTGINRISLGVQSLNDEELKRLGRNHDQQMATSAIHILQTNFHNISVDLLFGAEHQTMDSWKETLKKIANLGPQHISTYNLTIEKNTAYDKDFQLGKLDLPSDEIQVDMLLASKTFLSDAGYDTYEISNAGLPNYESKHNLLYWTGKPYLGLGVSAHSFHNQNFTRSWNTKNLSQYHLKIKNGLLPVEDSEILDQETHIKERIMTGIRLRKGIDLEILQKEGFDLSDLLLKKMNSLIQEGWLTKNAASVAIPLQHIPITNEILLRWFDT